MRLLHIEDQKEFREEIVKKLGRKFNVTAYTGNDAEGHSVDTKVHPDAGNPIEDQIVNQIRSLETADGEFDLVLLDTDLSAFKNGLSQSSIRSACSKLGIPVLRYSKKPEDTAAQKLKYLATIAREGSQSILVPNNLLKSAELVSWLVEVAKSFEKIRSAIRRDAILPPGNLLAKLIKSNSLESELLGYSGANFFFFGDLIEEIDQENFSVRNYSTQFGYWLANYVLLFPGPILNLGATAAFLETSKKDIEKEAVSKLLEKARYKGPFSHLGSFYLRSGLDDILFKADVLDFKELMEIKQIPITPLDYDPDGQPSYYCLINDCPVSTKNSVGPLDWIPRGAQICRIRKDTYNKFGPWLNV